MCREKKSKELAELIVKYGAGSSEWKIGYVYPEKADDVSLSITRAHGQYVRIAQADRIVFITNEPRRIRDAQPIEITAEGLESVLSDLIESIPEGGKTATNMVKRKNKKFKGRKIRGHVKSVNRRLEKAGATYDGEKKRSKGDVNFWKDTTDEMIEAVKASYDNPSSGDMPQYVPVPGDDPTEFYGEPEQVEIQGIE